MTPLAEKLRARIAAEGPIPVDAWMDACLADPEHGYYMTRDPLGRTGDFTTAPEISQMFGELLGLWCAVVWQQMGSPDGFRLIECGPGRGTLMSDALRAAAGLPGFRDTVHVHMVETSPALRAKQRAALAATGVPVEWHDAVTEVPPGPTILLANEFLDALPIRQLVRGAAGWHERAVDWDADGFVFVEGALMEAGDLPDAPAGAILEVAPAVDGAVADIAGRIVGECGAALFVDYGYVRPGVGETLQAVMRHGFADPLADPGHADLTAHVNFQAVAKVAEGAGARVWGPLPQGVFLETLGIGARTAALLAKADDVQSMEIATARRRLVDGDAMGRLFKVLAITGADAPAPPAFETVRL